MAWFTSRASSTKMPPSSSLISGNFPGSMYPKQMYFITRLLLVAASVQVCLLDWFTL
jgi:hypothetical protein